MVIAVRVLSRQVFVGDYLNAAAVDDCASPAAVILLCRPLIMCLKSPISHPLWSTLQSVVNSTDLNNIIKS